MDCGWSITISAFTLSAFLACFLFHAVECNLFHSAAHHHQEGGRNLKQDGLSMTVRSCTTAFHQDINVPVAPVVLKLSSDVLSWLHLGSRWQGDA